jgi:integrase
VYSDIHLLQLYRRWWTVNRRRAPGTVDRHLSELKFLQIHIDGASLLTVDRLTLEDWLTDRTERSCHIGRWAFRSVRSFYGWAVEQELIETSPAARLKGPKEENNPNPSTVTDEILARLRATIDPNDRNGDRDRAIIDVLWATGLRRGELLRMELHHIDLDAGTIMIPITKTRTPRVVPLSDDALGSLVTWLQRRITWHPATEDVWQAQVRGQVAPMTPNALRLMLERRSHRIGVKVSAHSFRRGATVELLRSGVSGPSVERIMGWSVGSPMMASYSRSLGQELALDEYRQKMAGGGGA